MLERTLRKNRTEVTFVLATDTPPGPVSVVGDFNDWQPGAHTLRPRKDGKRAVTVELPRKITRSTGRGRTGMPAGAVPSGVRAAGYGHLEAGRAAVRGRPAAARQAWRAAGRPGAGSRLTSWRRRVLVPHLAREVQPEDPVEKGERLEFGAGRHIGAPGHTAQHVQDGRDAEIVGEGGLCLLQQVGGDRPGGLLRPVGHLLSPAPQRPPGLGEPCAGDRDRRVVGVPEQQHPHSQRIGPRRGELVQKTRGEERGSVRDVPVRGCRADLAHVDQDPADPVLSGSAGREKVHVGSGAQRPGELVCTDGGGRVDAENGHGAIERLALLMRQVRCDEDREGLQTTQLRGTRQYVTDQGRPQVHRVDPGADGRQVDTDAQQVAVSGRNLHEAAGPGVGNAQHDAKASPENLR